MCTRAERQGLPVQRDVAVAGALLHDIGRSVTQDIRHATLGAAMLRQDAAQGSTWPEAVVLAVERHTGAGIDAQEAEALRLPVRDYTPRSLEERIVAHADNLYSADRRLTLDAVQAKYEAKRLPEAWEKVRRLHEALEAQLGVDLDALRPEELDLEPAPAERT